jgi:hypothetical protein
VSPPDCKSDLFGVWRCEFLPCAHERINMKKAIVVEKTIQYGKNQYKYRGKNNWLVLMWGWWPDGGSRPSSRWAEISAAKVPNEVKRQI